MKIPWRASLLAPLLASLLGFLSVNTATARPRPPEPVSGHDGWTGVISIHTVQTMRVDKPGRFRSSLQKDDAQIFLNPNGSVTSAATRFMEASEHLKDAGFDMHIVEIARGTGDPDNDPNISLDANDHFSINVQHLSIPLIGKRVGFYHHHDRSRGNETVNEAANFSAPLVDASDPNSRPGDRRLDGSKTYTEPPVGEEGVKLVSTVEWHLSYKEDLRLLVTVDQYDEWQPQGSTSETKRGNTLHVHAKLQKRDGTPSPEKADHFTFELVDTSAVPGTAINFPAAAAGGTPKKDLRIESGDDNPDLELQGEEGQTAKTKNPQQLEADAVVSCFDWGAYGAVRVSAQVGNRRVYGYLESDPAMADIRIPKRSSRSFIADAWKRAHSIPADTADDADLDDVPKSSVLDGDGLSLYEEYRGFYEHGDHKQGDPKTKDLFVLDKSSGKCIRGIELAARVSTLAIHYKFTPEEFPTSRIINFNNEPSTHQVDQHGLVFVANNEFGDSEANGRLRCPSEVRGDVEIHLIDPAVRGRANAEAEFHVTVAHELFHCVGVDHHGDHDPAVVEWRNPAPGKYVEYPFTSIPTPGGGNHNMYGAGVPITITQEDLTPLTDAQIADMFAFPLKIYIAAETGGEHSGNTHCVMKYNCCNAFIRGQKRVIIRRFEPLGDSLCVDAHGDVYNAPGADHGSRHGEAARGNCKAQIVVNDKRASAH